ncbi:DUF3021 family protein [Collinsella sp. TM10-22]|uniref:DUF3021 family protein n=1 Tax=unclassified Collinsella TaxID=2637548 RepID=UPI000E48DC0E|nr:MULTISPECIES: DUF3021 family protein [unclassified Collinsella]RGI67038.1 DUF3021 family protein [Collinsella sp. TM10-22]RHJ40047.1 DUF3021 family protein [Collinsella sp. AM10-48]RHJ41166.1 DUF3021 family protein [Collinsella sp. AM10-32]RHJ45717.1 DUF3021 family protein [Collinsella sp. AM10-27]RHJ46064.1 DUF3021 family protein [Collinsella sp. AM10-26]
MINRDIIDTDKKTPAENLGQLVKSTCIGFTVAMIAFLALGTCFADDTAKQGINYCWSILAACVTVPALQFVFFTPAVIRQMAYPARLALFDVCLYAALCALAFVFAWVPVNNPGAWVTFTVVYLAILAVLTLAFNAKLSRETRELNDRLAEYRKSRETE